MGPTLVRQLLQKAATAGPSMKRPYKFLGCSLLAMAASCSSGPGEEQALATLVIIPTFDDALALSQVELSSGDRKALVPASEGRVLSGERIRIELSREQDVGKPFPLEVWGLQVGSRVAHGSVKPVPLPNRAIEVPVPLTRLPCGAWCSEGAASCVGDNVRTCEQRDDDPCMEWSEAIPCPADAPYCSLGRCAKDCVDECVAGASRCAGPGAAQSCGQGDRDGCMDWLAPQPCEAGEVCEGGRCRVPGPCDDECGADERRCEDGGVVECGQYDTDDCLDWGPPVACRDGESCSQGICGPVGQCEDECERGACEGGRFVPCGQYDLDACLDKGTSQACAAEDPCQEGRCDPLQGCVQTAMTCDTPGPSVCVDGDTLLVSDAQGQCVQGVCVYGKREVSCPGCPDCDACASVVCNTPPQPAVCYQPGGTCEGGACSYAYANGTACEDGNACTEQDRCNQGACEGTPKVCNEPKAAECVSATTLRIYATPGTCGGGSCSYPYSDQSCAHGCVGGACVSDPCAGVSCSGPAPASSCVSSTVLRTYGTPGTCSGGACEYPFTDTTCPSGCSGGSCQSGCASCTALETCHAGVLCTAKLVSVPNSGQIDATEVTRSQYAAWLATSPSLVGQPASCSWNTTYTPECHWPPGAKGSYPVSCVDWCDAYAYCKGVGKSLCGKSPGQSIYYADDNPWYNACSRDDTRVYPYGNTYDGQACNGSDKGIDGALAVGTLTSCQSYPGIYDMSGNVGEWGDFCIPQAGTDYCIVQGGGFEAESTVLRCDIDVHAVPMTERDGRGANLGFRCCSP